MVKGKDGAGMPKLEAPGSISCRERTHDMYLSEGTLVRTHFSPLDFEVRSHGSGRKGDANGTSAGEPGLFRLGAPGDRSAVTAGFCSGPTIRSASSASIRS